MENRIRSKYCVQYCKHILNDEVWTDDLCICVFADSVPTLWNKVTQNWTFLGLHTILRIDLVLISAQFSHTSRRSEMLSIAELIHVYVFYVFWEKKEEEIIPCVSMCSYYIPNLLIKKSSIWRKSNSILCNFI